MGKAIMGKAGRHDPFAEGLLHRLPESPRKVALLRASRIGDFVCAGPAFRALRTALPEAEITIVTLPMLRDIAMRSPDFDRFEAFPGFPGIAEQLFDARETALFLRRMQAEHFDLAVQMQGSGVYSNPFTLLLGARVTAGFVRAGDHPGRLDAALPLPESGHEVSRVLALSEFLGAPAAGREPSFPLLAEDHAAAEALLAAVDLPLIGLHFAARDATRRWSVENFLAAGGALRRSYGGTLVIIGGPEEVLQAEWLRRVAGPPCLNLAGTTPLGTLGAVIARLAVLITTDSGPAHIAYALKTPTVAVFGGADPLRYGPPVAGPFRALVHPVPCRPCGNPVCPIDYRCLTGIAVEEAVAAAQQVMAPAEPQSQPHLPPPSLPSVSREPVRLSVS